MPLQKGDLPAFFLTINTGLWSIMVLDLFKSEKRKKSIWIKITIHTFTMKILKISYFH